jgi:hypothetical protein
VTFAKGGKPSVSTHCHAESSKPSRSTHIVEQF